MKANMTMKHTPGPWNRSQAHPEYEGKFIRNSLHGPNIVEFSEDTPQKVKKQKKV